MKKIFSIFMLMALFIMSAFAAEKYTVKDFKGDVRYEKDSAMIKVSKGTTISTDVVIQIGLYGELTVCNDIEEFTVKGIIKQSERKTLGRAIDEVVNKSKNNGLKKGNTSAIVNNVSKSKSSTSNSVSTASSRASEAKEDFEWCDD